MVAAARSAQRGFMHAGEVLRPHRWTVLLLTVVVEVAVLGSLAFARGEDAAVAVAVSFMVLTAVTASTLAGPLVGAAAALLGGGVFWVTVAHLGADESLLATAVTTAMWMLAAALSGVIADALREQVTKRGEASVALAQSNAVRETAEHLLEATAAFHGGESPRQVADDVCRAARRSFGCALAALSFVEGDKLHVAAASPHTDRGLGRSVALVEHPAVARLIALERPSFWAPEQAPDAAGASFAALLPFPAGGAVAHVPLRVGGTPLALLTLAWDARAVQPDAERLAIMQRFADQAAIALLEARRAHAHAQVERLHQTLEASLLPVMPLEDGDLEIVTAYRPGEDRLALGGDFYDVMTLPDGRLALILGDVAGHGPNAAALGARLRAGWQALTLSGAAPPVMLDSLSRMVQAQASADVFATVMLAWIDPVARTAALLSAGHPPPLLLANGVRPIPVPAHLPLGLDQGGRPRPTIVHLPRRWTLFFYTDGLVEGRASPSSPERCGEDGLRRRLREYAAAGFDRGVLDRVLAAIEAANGAAFGDDVAVVAVSERRSQRTSAKTA